MRARTVSLAVICFLFAVSSTVEQSALAARQQQRRATKATGRAKVPAKPPRRPVSQHELNGFLRSPAGKAKLKVYKQQAFDAPRLVAHPTGQQPFTSLGAKHKAYKTSGRLTKIATYATSVVTGAIGGMFGGFVGMMTGGMPSGPEMLHSGAHPAMHFLSQGHVIVGAIIGAGGAIAAGTAIAMGFKRAARKVDLQAEEEAVARILGELETGMENQPPAAHPGFASANFPGGGRGQQRDILNDLWGAPGSLFGPQQSAAERGSHHDGISDVGPSGGFDFGPPGSPP